MVKIEILSPLMKHNIYWSLMSKNWSKSFKTKKQTTTLKISWSMKKIKDMINKTVKDIKKTIVK